MAVFNHVRKEIDAKIVYYGPGISGKTTNLQQIHQRLKPDQRGKMISLATNEDRTLFFDFLPIELGSVRGFKTRFHLYTVPGQVYYGATRRAVLTGADGVVFVADSQADRLEDNLVSLEDLEENLRYYGKKIETVPLIVQYNKRDLANVLSVEDLNGKINRWGSPYFESVASSGQGVFEALTAVCRLVLKAIETGAHARPADADRASGIEEAKKTPGIERAPLRAGSPLSVPRTESPAMQPGKQPAERSRPEMPGATPQVDPGRSVPPLMGPGIGKEASIAGAMRREPDVSAEWTKNNNEGADIRTDRKKKEEGRSILNWMFNRQGGAKAEEMDEMEGGSGQESIRIVSCGQPRLAPPREVEIPLELEIAGPGKTLSVQLRLSINLERLDLKVD